MAMVHSTELAKIFVSCVRTFMAGHSLRVINLDLFSAYISILASEYT